MKTQQKGQDTGSERYGRQYGESSIMDGVERKGVKGVFPGVYKGQCVEGGIWNKNIDERVSMRGCCEVFVGKT